MRYRPRPALVLVLLALVWAGLPPRAARSQAEPPGRDERGWPAATRESRPWTRWWWLGSAVDEANLTRQLEEFARAGLGGVEICPIYGAKGWEDRYVPFLSPRWMELLAHATREAKRLGLGIDLTTGTGWPFGGPSVTVEDASASLVLKRYEVAGGGRVTEKLPEGTPLDVVALSEGGERVDLTSRAASDGQLDWTAPPGSWRVYAALAQGPVQKVKRAAPGGEGSVLDPYSVAGLERYLSRFDAAFEGFAGEPPRAHFHDSFEYYGASATRRLFPEFAARRGYDLRDRIEALFGDGPEDTVARVKSDIRETLSDLHLAYVRRWTAWAHERGSLSRNQAHGAPGNLLDLYAAADIPETEVFRRVDEVQMPRLKLASSAAHVSGRALASAEAFTWLGEHFQVPLWQVKEAADWLLLSGVNHLVYHGIPYSPAEAPWPGWQFYASVNFGPMGGLWRDLPELDDYLTRVQSVLQSGEPDEDVLLFYSPRDVWHASGDLIKPNPVPSAYEETGLRLWRRGFAWDAVSDRLLAEIRVEDGRMRLGGGRYRTLVVPHVRLMSADTLRRLADLAREGASILLLGGAPEDVPGLGALDARRAVLLETLRSIGLEPGAGRETRRLVVGRGRVLTGDDVEALLAEAGVTREPMVDHGIQLVRRRHARGRHYFLANRGAAAVDGWLPLGVPARSAVLLDPRSNDRAGAAALRRGDDGAAEVFLQLEPGESIVLRTFSEAGVEGSPWPCLRPVGPPVPITGMWTVRFVEGGPALPAGLKTGQLASWTTLGDEEARRFAGTARYEVTLERPPGTAEEWQLDLGGVGDSARVFLNGRPVARLWSRPFRAALGQALRPGRNTLVVDVTSLAANRVRDLDRRGVPWKAFHDINVVGVDYKPLDASGWPLRDSGLLGPVSLRRLERCAP